MADDTSPRRAPQPGSEAGFRTFLFADMRGYTRFTQDHGDDAASALAGRFADLVREAVPEYEGELLELRGDEALCVFRSARQAFRASVELQRRLRSGTDEDPAFPIGVGMGLDAGEAVPTQGGYRGASLNLAARLCALAKPGQILASESAAHVARRVDGVRLVRRRAVRVKGIAEPVRIIEAEPERPLPPVPTARRRRGRRWVAVAGLVLAALAGAAAIFVSSRTGKSATSVALRPSSLVVVGAHTDRILADYRLPIGANPAPLVLGDGALWAYNDDRQTVIRINPLTGRYRERGLGFVPTDIAVGAGFVWLADGVANKLYRLDWGSRLPPVAVNLPPSPVQPNYYAGERPSTSGQVTTFRGTVWATAQGVSWPQTVVAYHAENWARIHRYRVSTARNIGDVESGPAGVWMENRIGGPGSGRAGLVPLAPSFGRAHYVSQGGYLQQGVAVGRSAVWFAPGKGTGSSGRTIAALQIRPPYSWTTVVTPTPVTAIAAGPAGVWAASATPGTLYRMSLGTNTPNRAVPLRPYVTGIAVGKDRVWALIQGTPIQQG